MISIRLLHPFHIGQVDLLPIPGAVCGKRGEWDGEGLLPGEMIRSHNLKTFSFPFLHWQPECSLKILKLLYSNVYQEDEL
jgi:hypothetical protein